MVNKDKTGIRTMPQHVQQEQQDGGNINECVVLDTFTTIKGNSRMVCGLLFKNESHEFMLCTAEPPQTAVNEQTTVTTKWTICTIGHDMKFMVDRFYAVKLGLSEIKQTGVVTIIV